MRIKKLDGILGHDSKWYTVRFGTQVDLDISGSGIITNGTKLQCYVRPPNPTETGTFSRFPYPSNVSVYGVVYGQLLYDLGVADSPSQHVRVAVRFISKVEAELTFNATNQKGALEP